MLSKQKDAQMLINGRINQSMIPISIAKFCEKQ